MQPDLRDSYTKAVIERRLWSSSTLPPTTALSFRSAASSSSSSVLRTCSISILACVRFHSGISLYLIVVMSLFCAFPRPVASFFASQDLSEMPAAVHTGRGLEWFLTFLRSLDRAADSLFFSTRVADLQSPLLVSCSLGALLCLQRTTASRLYTIAYAI